MKVYCPIRLINHLKILMMKDDFKNGETFSLHESLNLGEQMIYKYLEMLLTSSLP